MGSLQPDFWTKQLSCVPAGGSPHPPNLLPEEAGLVCWPVGTFWGGDGHLRQENPEFGTPGYSAVGHVTAPGFSVWFGSQEVSVNRVPTQKVGL